MVSLYWFILVIFLIGSLFPVISWGGGHRKATSNCFADYSQRYFGEKLVDCQKTIRLCSNNQDCVGGCIKDLYDFICTEERCTLAVPTLSPEEKFDCNNNHGIYLLLGADGGFHCTSLFPQFYDNLDRVQPYTCENGQLYVNTALENPSVNSCTCFEGYMRVAHIDLQHIPTCIPEKSVSTEEYIAI